MFYQWKHADPLLLQSLNHRIGISNGNQLTDCKGNFGVGCKNTCFFHMPRQQRMQVRSTVCCAGNEHDAFIEIAWKGWVTPDETMLGQLDGRVGVKDGRLVAGEGFSKECSAKQVKIDKDCKVTHVKGEVKNDKEEWIEVQYEL